MRMIFGLLVSPAVALNCLSAPAAHALTACLRPKGELLFTDLVN